MTYDLIVLGGGPAGYNASERAAEKGMSVLCIEKEHLGGVCLNEGCIPTKTLLYSAKLLDGAKHGDKYGVTATDITLDQNKVVTRKNKVVKTLVSGIKSSLKSHGVEVVTDTAQVAGKNGDLFVVKTSDGTEYMAKNLLIATGSSPVIPPIPGAKEGVEAGTILTNREILALQEVPERLVIIGGGVIGLEMASYFNSVGASVTVVEMLDHIAGESDRELSEALMKVYQQKGINFMLNTRACEFKDKVLVVENENGQSELFFDYALMSVGRRANTADLGLDSIGVTTERGAVVTDEHLMTNVPGVYAAGDVNGKSMLAHTAYREGEVAVNHMAGVEDKMSYSAIPAVIYTNPELASIGFTETSAEAAGLDFRAVKVNMRYSGRYLAENEGGTGVFKFIVDNKTNRVLGAHVLANYSSEFIVSVGVMMEAGMTLDQIKRVVFPHPTVGEIIREAVYMAK